MKATLAHCMACRCPLVMVDGVIPGPVVLYADGRGQRIVAHRPECEYVGLPAPDPMEVPGAQR